MEEDKIKILELENTIKLHLVSLNKIKMITISIPDIIAEIRNLIYKKSCTEKLFIVNHHGPVIPLAEIPKENKENIEKLIQNLTELDESLDDKLNTLLKISEQSYS